MRGPGRRGGHGVPRLVPVGLLLASSAWAAGFALPEQSARSVGAGGTGTASATGASALYYDVGNLAFEDGLSAELSAAVIVPTFRYEPLRAVDGTPATARPQVFTQPAVFVAAPVEEGVFVGVGGFSNFGLGLTWPEGFDGRFDSTSSNVTTFTVNPGAAWRIDRHLGVGAGVDVVRGTVELGQALDFVDQAGALKMGAGTWGVGFNAGLGGRWLVDDLSAGLAFRSAVPLDFKGRAHFTAPPEFAASLADQEVRTRITLPNQLSAGVSYRVHPKVRASVDLTYTTWSSFRVLAITFPGDPTLDKELRRDWKNTLTARAGAEVTLWKGLTARLGAGFDPSPSPSDTLSPSLPDADRVLASAGAGYRAGNFSADLGYMLVLLLPRESSGEAFPARYSGMAHLVALTVAFRQ